MHILLIGTSSTSDYKEYGLDTLVPRIPPNQLSIRLLLIFPKYAAVEGVEKITILRRIVTISEISSIACTFLG